MGNIHFYISGYFVITGVDCNTFPDTFVSNRMDKIRSLSSSRSRSRSPIRHHRHKRDTHSPKRRHKSHTHSKEHRYNIHSPLVYYP